jgi:hypothetical protein
MSCAVTAHKQLSANRTVDGLPDGRGKDRPERRGRQQERPGRPVLNHQYQDPPGDRADSQGRQGVRDPAEAPVRALMVVGQRP